MDIQRKDSIIIIVAALVLADNNGPTYIFTKLNEIKPERVTYRARRPRRSTKKSGSFRQLITIL